MPTPPARSADAVKASGQGHPITCPECGERFSRHDHLSRHRQSHVEGPTHDCPICKKSFTRADSMRRHRLGHQQMTNSSRMSIRSTADRIPQACLNCAKSKLRCNGESPCSRCKDKDLDCLYQERRKRRIKPTVRRDETPSDSQNIVLNDVMCNADILGDGDSSSSIPMTDDFNPLNWPDNGTTSSSLDSIMVSRSQDPPNSSSGPDSHEIDGEVAHNENRASLSLFPAEKRPPHSITEDGKAADAVDGLTYQPASSYSSHMEHTYSPSTWNEWFTLQDWMVIDPPFQLTTAEQMGLNNRGDGNLPSLTWALSDHEVPFQNDAFSAQIAEFGKQPIPPAQQEVHGSGEPEWVPKDWHTVHIPNMEYAPIDILEAEDFAHVPCLSTECYASLQRITANVNEASRPSSQSSSRGLPPLKLINCFIQLYFEHFQPFFPLLHQPSFDSSTLAPELVLAVVTIGCRYSKASGSDVCALALSELLKRSLMSLIEEDNSCTGNLWFNQAMCLNIIAMLYSGDKRLFQFGTGGRHYLMTLCRLNKITNPSPGARYYHELLQEDESLKKTWLAWTQDEARRRLGFCCWILDCHLPLFFDIDAAMDFQELQQYLPCHESLWEATNSSTWRTLVFQLPDRQISLRTALLPDISEIKDMISDFGRLILLFAICVTGRQIRQLQDNPLLSKIDQFQNSAGQEAFRHQARKYIRILQHGSGEELGSHFHPALNSSSNTAFHSNLRITAHHAGILLHAPMLEILNYTNYFATSRDITKFYERLTLWAEEDKGRTIRRAVFHAAILFGFISSRSCYGFHEPIAFMTATLTLWTFIDLCAKSQNKGSTSPQSNFQVTVRLDKLRGEDEALEWIERGHQLRAHLTDIGNILSPGSSKRLIGVAWRTLESLTSWKFCRRFQAVLTALENHDPFPAS